MEVADGEEVKPSSRIGARTMDEHKRGREFHSVFPRDHVHHSCRVLDGIIPECTWHLLFGEVRP